MEKGKKLWFAEDSKWNVKGQEICTKKKKKREKLFGPNCKTYKQHIILDKKNVKNIRTRRKKCVHLM